MLRFHPAGQSSEGEEEKAREREQFKLDFLDCVERRAAALLGAGMRVLLLGDFNIAPNPAADRASAADAPRAAAAEPPSRSRQWLRRLLAGGGGALRCADAFRVSHPLPALRILAAPMTTAGGNVRWLLRMLFPDAPAAEGSRFETRHLKQGVGGVQGGRRIESAVQRQRTRGKGRRRVPGRLERSVRRWTVPLTAPEGVAWREVRDHAHALREVRSP